MPRESRRRFSLAAEILLIVAVVVTPLSLGGAPRWATPPAVFLSCAALVLAVVSATRRKLPIRIPLIAAGLIVAAVACGLQLVPLPFAWLRFLSPAAGETTAFVLEPLGLSPVRPLSIDPSATHWELARHLAYASALIAASYVGAARPARQRLLQAIALTGVAVVGIGFVHRFLGLTSLLGLYSYKIAQPPLLSTFGNANHFAGFLILTSAISLGLALRSDRAQDGWLWGLAYAAQGVGVLLSLSRAGIGAFVATQLLLAIWMLLRPWLAKNAASATPPRGSSSAASGKSAALVAAAAAAVIGIAAYLALDRIAAELETANSVEKLRTSKIEMWPSMAQAVRAFAGTGMGRGAFQLGYSRYQDRDASEQFSHAENFVLQLGSELGVPVTLIILALAAWGVARLFRERGASPLDAAVLCGVVGLAGQNLFDFSLELPACALCGAVALGLVARANEGPAGTTTQQPRRAQAFASFATVTALLALWLGRHDFHAAETRIETLAMSGNLRVLKAAAREEIDRHPADYLLHDWVAQAAAAHREPREALASVNRALFLRPIDPAAHLLAARSLMTLGHRRQAFLEYRLAASGGEGHALVEAIPLVKTYDELAEVVPLTAGATLDAARTLTARRAALAEQLIEERAQGELSSSGDLWLELAAFRRGHDVPSALTALEKAAALMPEDPRPTTLRAEILAGQKQPSQAIALLDTYVKQHPAQLGPWLSLARLHLAMADPVGTLDVLRRASPFVTTAAERSQLLVAQSAALRAQGKTASALDAMRSASRLVPESASLQYALAQQLEALGRPREAIHAIEQGRQHDSPQAAQGMQDWISRLEQQERKMREQQDLTGNRDVATER